MHLGVDMMVDQDSILLPYNSVILVQALSCFDSDLASVQISLWIR